MSHILILSSVLILATASLFLKKSVSAMISFAMMMFILGIFYISLGQSLLGLFQIFIYTGGVVVLLLFGLTVIGVEFPPHRPRVWAGVVSFLLFVALSTLFVRGLDSKEIVAKTPEVGARLFSSGYEDFVVIFALIGISLIYATVKMSSLLKRGKNNDRV